ncbi:MAG: VOC family protein [Chloroflexi bacterium]|nr:VOC family protein [Chloroflexota bacterium]
MGSDGLGPIGQIALHVSDVEKSVEFYGGLLGMVKIFAAPNLAFFDNGGVRLMLSSAKESSGESSDKPGQESVHEHGPAHGSVIYYRVDDVQTSYEQFVSAGVVFQDEPHIVHSSANYELWMSFFKDPDGNQLAIMSEIGELS